MPSAVVHIEGLDELRRRLGYVEADSVSKKLLNEIGLFLRTGILERTAAGEDIWYDSFEPYSPQYEVVREQAGLPTDPVDLFFTGSMLSALTFEVDVTSTSAQVSLFFMPTEDKFGMFNPEKAFYLNKHREFFGFNVDDVDTVMDVARTRIRNAIRRKRGRR